MLLLDGQQRLTSLSAVLNGLPVEVLSAPEVSVSAGVVSASLAHPAKTSATAESTAAEVSSLFNFSP
jgi:hypothetical protein